MREMQKELNYDEVVKTEPFKQLIASKKRFIIPMSLFFFIFYFALPILTSYSEILNSKVFGDVTLAWVFAFGQFIMTWVLCILYSNKAKKFDKLSEETLAQFVKKESA